MLKNKFLLRKGKSVPPSKTTNIPPRTQQNRPIQEKTENINKHAKRRDTVLELITYISIPLIGKAALEQTQLNENEISPYSLDVETINLHKKEFASIVVALSDEFPVIGVLLDRVSGAGPIAAMVTMSLTIGLQFAENHGKLPDQVRKIAPIIPREDLALGLKQEADARHSANQVVGNGSN